MTGSYFFRSKQIVHSSRRGSRDIEHIGSAHDEAELEALKAAARQRLAAGQGELDLGPGRRQRGRRSGRAVADHLLADGASVGRAVPRLRRARVRPRPPAGTRCSGSWCWRGSSSRPASWTACGCWPRPASTRRRIATLKRRLPVYAEPSPGGSSWPRPAPRTPRLGPASLVLYDVSTLYFETDAGTGSASRGSPRNAAWNRRSPSACSPTRPGSR